MCLAACAAAVSEKPAIEPAVFLSRGLVLAVLSWVPYRLISNPCQACLIPPKVGAIGDSAAWSRVTVCRSAGFLSGAWRAAIESLSYLFACVIVGMG